MLERLSSLTTASSGSAMREPNSSVGFSSRSFSRRPSSAGRPQSAKRPCFFYIDECQNVIRRDEKISAILDECRSQKIGMILAHQRTAQITSANVLDALSNCAIRMANSDDDAKYLSDKL